MDQATGNKPNRAKIPKDLQVEVFRRAGQNASTVSMPTTSLYGLH